MSAAKLPQLVYFVRLGEAGPIKIGISRWPTKRLGEMQVGVAEHLHLLVAIQGGRQLERHYHAAYDLHHIRGEWFHPAGEILAEVQRLIAAGLDCRKDKSRATAKIRYLRSKVAVTGLPSFYWEPPQWAKPPAIRNGKLCPVAATALGNTLGPAAEAATRLNECLDAWRLSGRGLKRASRSHEPHSGPSSSG